MISFTKLALISLLALPLFAQNLATFNNFSPTVKGVTVGNEHCYFWAHYPVRNKMTSACYIDNVAVRVMTESFIVGTESNNMYSTALHVQIIYEFHLTANGLVFYITTEHPDNTAPIIESGMFP